MGVAAGGSYRTRSMDEWSDLDLVIAVEPPAFDAVMADRQRIAAEWPQMERLDHDPLVEAEVAKTDRLAFSQRGPVDRRDSRAAAQSQLVERDDRAGHLQSIINNNAPWEGES